MVTLPPLPPSTEPPLPPSPMDRVPVTLSDMEIGGSYLLTLSVIFIFIDSFLSWLVYKSWRTIKKSKFYNSFLLGVLLTLADLLFALLVGLPAGIHLKWVHYFGKQAGMRFYNRVVGYMLFEYIFLLRVLLIAALSTDAFIHIQLPFRYYDIVTNRRARWASVVIGVLPLLVRTVPNAVYLVLTNAAMTCMLYSDPSVPTSDRVRHSKKFSVPLGCAQDIGEGTAQSVSVNTHLYVTLEVVMLASVTALAWLTIVLTNAAMLVVVVKGLRNSLSGSSQSGGSVTKKLTKSTFLIVCIAVSFVLTHFPYVCVWCAEYHFNANPGVDKQPVNNRLRFYLTLLTFISLLFHPWLYLLRLQSVRNIILSFKKKLISSLSYTSTMRISLSKLGSSLSSPVAPVAVVMENKAVTSPNGVKTGLPLNGTTQCTNIAGETSNGDPLVAHKYTVHKNSAV